MESRVFEGASGVVLESQFAWDHHAIFVYYVNMYFCISVFLYSTFPFGNPKRLPPRTQVLLGTSYQPTWVTIGETSPNRNAVAAHPFPPACLRLGHNAGAVGSMSR